ncbi:hypothetical protein ACFLTE_08985 [Bacteroidota bacterium]
MKNIIKLTSIITITILLFYQCSTCMFRQQEYGGFNKIPLEEYEFLNPLANTFKFTNRDSNIFIITNYKKDLVVKNLVNTEGECTDYEYDYEEYNSYYHSSNIEIVIGIRPQGGFYHGGDGFDYTFQFIIENNDTNLFVLWSYDNTEFHNDSIVTLTDVEYKNGNERIIGTLKIQKSKGLLSLQTRKGNRFNLVEDK